MAQISLFTISINQKGAEWSDRPTRSPLIEKLFSPQTNFLFRNFFPIKTFQMATFVIFPIIFSYPKNLSTEPQTALDKK